MLKNKKIFQIIIYILVCSFVAMYTTGCASYKKTGKPDDPFENYNRKAYAFNQSIDKAFIIPIVKAYQIVIPWPIRKGVSNFYSNINLLPTVINDLLQLQLADALSDTWRLGVNSTIGIAGVFDPASPMGLKEHHNDFGLTLATWGDKQSPFVVIPFFGPSTIRDSFGITIDYLLLSIYPHIDSGILRFSLLGGEILDLRSRLLEAQKLAKLAAIDPYAFERDAYLQNRKFKVQHGKVDDPYIEAGDEESEDAYIEEGDEKSKNSGHDTQATS